MCLFWLSLVACDEYEIIDQYNQKQGVPAFISINLKRGEALRIKTQGGYPFLVITSQKKFYMNVLGLYWYYKSRDYHADEPGIYVFGNSATVEYVALESGVHTAVVGNMGSQHANGLCTWLIAKDSISRRPTVDYVGLYCYVQTNLEFPMKVTGEGRLIRYAYDWVGLNRTDKTYLFYDYEDMWEGTLLEENVAFAHVRQYTSGNTVPVEIRSEGDGTRNFGTHRYDDMRVNDSQPPFYWKDANTKTRMKEGRYVPPPSPTRSTS